MGSIFVDWKIFKALAVSDDYNATCVKASLSRGKQTSGRILDIPEDRENSTVPFDTCHLLMASMYVHCKITKCNFQI